MKNKILVVCAHPDDEVLGMGGTIAKKISQGDEVRVLILGDGETSRGSGANIKKRNNVALQSAKFLGISKIYSKQFADQKFDSIPLLKINKEVEKVIKEYEPNVVYTHNINDLNLDHQITARSVLTACRPQPDFCVKRILFFEVLSSTEWQIKEQGKMFCPNHYENISGFLNKKLEAINFYKDELRDFPHPRSIEGINVLSQYRGIEVGYKNAEAFFIVRDLND